jgi:hypothetical protein
LDLESQVTFDFAVQCISYIICWRWSQDGKEVEDVEDVKADRRWRRGSKWRR